MVRLLRSEYKSIQNSQTLQDYIFHIIQYFAAKLHNFTKFRKLFPTVLKLFSNLKVCLIGEWSTLNVFVYFPFQVVFAVSQFVSTNLGRMFIESPNTDLSLLYKNMASTIPLVFILSTGSDPMNAFLRFAKEMSYTER